MFYNGLKPHINILLDGCASGSMMTRSAEEAMTIIIALIVCDYKAQHDKS